MMVLIMKNELYHDSNVNPNVHPKVNMTVVRHPVRHACMPINQIIIQIYM